MHKSVVHIHNDTLASPGEAFSKAHAAVIANESSWARDSREAREALERFDRPFRMARSALLAYDPDRKLPDPLKSQPTDTDKLVAIEDVYAAVKAHAGKGWADELLQGEFGALAQESSAALRATIATAKALAKAREDRMSAYTLAYDRFIAFKRVVRDALGASSPQYRRIHIRSGAKAKAPEAAAPQKETAPPQVANDAPAAVSPQVSPQVPTDAPPPSKKAA